MTVGAAGSPGTARRHVPASPGEPGAYDAVVLTGGRATRMGGAAKPALLVGGLPIAARVLAAVAGAQRSIVVGEPVPGVRADVVTREEPAGGGPVAGLAAGLAAVRAPVVAVLGGDLPFVTAAAVRQLREALAGEPAAAAVLLVDDAGRDQHLCGVWRSDALRSALAAVGDPTGVPLRAVLAVADGPVLRRSATGGGPPVWFDCDTEQDLATAREWAGG